MKLKNDYIMRNIAGDNMVIPRGAEADRLKAILTLNDSGAFLWKLLETEQTEQTLIDALLDKYDVDADTAQNEVKKFVSEVKELGCFNE